MEDVKEFVKDKLVAVKDVRIETERNKPDVIRRIKFETDKGNISYKPKITKEVKRAGIPVTQTTQCTLDEIPQKVIDIYNTIKENGVANVKMCYTKWTTEDSEGDEVTYRFIQYESELDNWRIMGDGEE